MPYLAAVPRVSRTEPFLCKFNVFVCFLAPYVRCSILAALADEKRPRLAHADLKVTKSTMLAVFMLARKPCHKVRCSRSSSTPGQAHRHQ